MRIWLRRIFVALLGACLAWRIVALGMAEFYAGQIAKDPDAAASALAWYPDYPKALSGLAGQSEGEDPARAEALLARAYRGDPTDGMTLLRLAELWRRQGQLEKADRACELAERLFPADARLHLQAAQYWLAAGDQQKTLQDWSLAMQIDPALAPSLYPVLLNAAKDPQGLKALGSLIAGLPSWWQGFFVYAAENVAEIDALRALYSLHKAAGQAFSPEEINAYLARLMREGLWTEAYMDWVNALGHEQQQVLGYLYDGGFELTEFQGGFDWKATPVKSIQVSTNYTQTVTGKKALHIVIDGGALPPFLVEQTVFLLPGHYRFSGRVRPDGLQAVSGLEWSLACASGDGGRRAASERFLGSDVWRKFAVDFEVASEACAGVRLRLQPVGYQTFEREMKGEIWFDDLAIEMTEGQAGEISLDASAAPEKREQAESGARESRPASYQIPGRKR